MKKLFTIILLFVNLICSATNYYVKNSGSDAANGLTDGTAWATINKVNTSTFAAGDTIFFNKGDTWRETLILPSSGTAGAYIVFSSYGTGDKPKILGSTQVTGWTQDNLFGAVANWDLLSESFEGAGYEHTWVETVGANESNIVDQDNADIAAPTGGGSSVLKIVKDITPTATAAASAAMTQSSLTTNRAITYIDFYVLVNAHGLSTNGDLIYLMKALDNAYEFSTTLMLRNLSGDIKLSLTTKTGTATTSSSLFPTSGSITLDQWYHIQILYDVTNHLFSVTVDDNILGSGALNAGHALGVDRIYIGDYEYVKTATLYYDLVNISSTNFPTEEIVLPANVWKGGVTVNNPRICQDVDAPTGYGDVFFDDRHGAYHTFVDLSELTDEYDWTWARDTVLVYAATDPDSRYTAVEAAQRSEGIRYNDKEYITFDGLYIAYSQAKGIGSRTYPTPDLSGLIIKNCEVAHVGYINSLDASNIVATHSDMLIQNCIIHDAGRRGVSLSPVSNNLTHNIIIENCTFYDGHHTTGPDLELVGPPFSGNLDSVIIRNNLIYEAADYAEITNLIYAEVVPGGGVIRGLYIYNNIFKNSNQAGIQFGGVTDAYIYNNTFYGHNQVKTTNSYQLLLDYGSTNITVKNNIFYGNAVYATLNNSFAIYLGGSQTNTALDIDYNLYYTTDAASDIIRVNSTHLYNMTEWAAMKAYTGWDTNSPTPTDPLFTSDYHLQSTSPAKDAGVDVGLTTDYSGHRRPYNYTLPDIGAYEWGQRYLMNNSKIVMNNGKIVKIEQ